MKCLLVMAFVFIATVLGEQNLADVLREQDYAKFFGKQDYAEILREQDAYAKILREQDAYAKILKKQDAYAEFFGKQDYSFPNTPDIDTSQYMTSQTSTLEDVERLFHEKCLKNSNEEAYQRAKDAQEKMGECIMSLVNVTEFQEELERVKDTNNIEKVFLKKYCRLWQPFRQCNEDSTTSIEPCLDADERETYNLILKVEDELAEFVCFKDGDRIALFIAEGGPQCLQDNEEGIYECVPESLKTTLRNRISNQLLAHRHLPMLVSDLEECKDLKGVQKCVVNTMKSCPKPAPANLAEAVFNILFKITPCDHLLHNGAATTAVAQVTLASLLALVATRLL